MALKRNTGSYTQFAKQTPEGEPQKLSMDQSPAEVSHQIGQNIERPAKSGPMAQPSAPLAGAAGMRSDAKEQANTYKTDSQGNFKLGEPKVYDSVGSAGSGFVNLSHLLGLNKASGAKSAIDLANRMDSAGKDASKSIASHERRFEDEARAGTTSFLDYQDGDLLGENIAQKGYEKAAQGYKGPSDMTQTSGYEELSKKVNQAAGMAKNISGDGFGLAAQVSKDTGLSPVQSAASAFYMGVNNPNLKRAGNAFTGLQQALADANARSVNTAQLSREFTRTSADRLKSNSDAFAKARKDYDDTAARTTAWAEARTKQQIDEEARQAAQDAINKNHRNSGETEIRVNSDMEWNIKQGMPAEISYLGVSFDDWVAAGKPSWEKWKQMHPEAVPIGSDE